MANSIKSILDLSSVVTSGVARIKEGAQWAIDNIPGIEADEVSKGIRTEWKRGCVIAFAALPQNAPCVLRPAESGSYQTMPKGTKALKDDCEFSVAYALSLTQKELGELKASKPELHKLVRATRDDVSTYASGAWRDLRRYVMQILHPTRDRKATRGWSEVCDETLKGLIKTAGNLRTKGFDAPTAEMVTAAVVAFETTIKKMMSAAK